MTSRRGKRKVTKRCPVDRSKLSPACKWGECYFAHIDLEERQEACLQRCTWYRRMVAKRRRSP